MNDRRHEFHTGASGFLKPGDVRIVLGADGELGGFVDGPNGSPADGSLSGDRAAVLSLAEYKGVAAERSLGGGYGLGGQGQKINHQDRGRKFLLNGGCAYIDLSHLEICLPETTSAYDHVASHQAALAMAGAKLKLANAKLPAGQKIHLMVNNSDGQGNSYGSHVNFQIPRETYENIFLRKPHYLGYLVSQQASSIVITGQGKVGSENGQPPVDYQISQRADFFETVMGLQTTYNRPLANSRDEAHCGELTTTSAPWSPADTLARLHVIFFDYPLCPWTCEMRVGPMQLLLGAMAEERINPDLILDDPLDAVHRWSHDPGLEARARLITGEEVTAVELQRRFHAEAQAWTQERQPEYKVPGYSRILEHWGTLLEDLEDRRFDRLAPRLDWVLKKTVIERAMTNNPDWDWQSPEVKHLDQIYGSLDPDEGLFLAFQESGFVEQLVQEQDIVKLHNGPPEDTRAWTRAMLLRLGGNGAITEVNWDLIRYRERGPDGWYRDRRLELADPAGFTREQVGHLFDGSLSFSEIMEHLGATQDEPRNQNTYWGYQ